jgi:two-component system chemotaxis response regulator CheY
MPTVLLVDDSEVGIAISRTILERSGYAVVSAGDGNAALALLADGVCPDVVVTDLEMPRVDGLQLLRALRDAEPTHDLPVLVYSSTDQARRRAAAEDAGANAWLDKPADPARLLSAIEQLLHGR